MSTGIDLTIEDFEQAIEYIMDQIGSDFDQALRLANGIIAAPNDYTGPQAAQAAVAMAQYRYRIGVAAQYWKVKSAQTKKLQDRLVKDALMSAFTGLEEVINTLKIVARYDYNIVERA